MVSGAIDENPKALDRALEVTVVGEGLARPNKPPVFPDGWMARQQATANEIFLLPVGPGTRTVN